MGESNQFSSSRRTRSRGLRLVHPTKDKLRVWSSKEEPSAGCRLCVQCLATEVRIYIQNQPTLVDRVSDVTVESEVRGRVDIANQPIQAFVIIDRPLTYMFTEIITGFRSVRS